MKALIDELEEKNILPQDKLKTLLTYDGDYLFERARAVTEKTYGNKIFARGLIEFTNHCKNDCYYCGLRRSNRCAERFRLTQPQILECCKTGYDAGFRTFVLQGGEDVFFNDDVLAETVGKIKAEYGDCAITLSVGERSRESYQRLYDAGVDRYLLRHETANDSHYAVLHPAEMSPKNRKDCLNNLKQIGYQVGCGFMVGSPQQTMDHIVEDLFFIREFRPHMVGVGTFLPHSSTPFAGQKAGDLRLALNILSILRLISPNLLIPATTALGTAAKDGRELGILAGANVIMPNISPLGAKQKYMLYDNKPDTDVEFIKSFENIKSKLNRLGFQIVSSRGDYNGI